MAEEKEATVEKTESVSKLNITLITTMGVIVAGGISASVSYFVSKGQVEFELQKLRIEESLEKAQIFQDLVDKVRSTEDPTFALLALWKVFPNDKQLIVTTALMNPTPQTVSTLHAFGIADELDQYNDVIANMMINAPPDRRREFTNTYRDVSPSTVLDVNVEAVIRSGGDKRDLTELVNFVGYRPDMVRPLVEKMRSDARIADDPVLTLRLARDVYERDSAPLIAVMDAAETDGDLFHLLAREMVNHLQLLSANDLDRMLERSLSALEQLGDENRSVRRAGDVIDLFSELSAQVEPTPRQTKRFSDAVVPLYLTEARGGRVDMRKLTVLGRFAPGDLAGDLFLETIACAAERDASLLHAAFSVDDLAIENWEEDQALSAARAEARQRIDNKGLDCGLW